MTAIYNTGTVSVTNGNAVVTGSGTAWAVSLVTGGTFYCAGMAVPILSVESDTSLTLALPWPGTTGAGRAYAIERENSAAANVVDLYDKLTRVLVQLSLAGITPNASGSIADRDAITLGTGDKGFLFLHAQIGVAFAFYRWTGTAWDGPFSVANAVAGGGVSSIVSGAGIAIDNTNPAIPVVSVVRPGSAKTTPVDADELSLFDSAASYALKRLTWGNLKALLLSAATFFTSLTGPKLIGGTGAGSSLTLQSTSGAGTTDFINFLVGNNGSLEAARLDTNGVLLLGNPAAVGVGSASTQMPKFQLHDPTNTAQMCIYRWSNAGTGAIISLAKSRGAAVGSRAVVQSGDTLGSVAAFGDDGANFPTAADILFAVDGTPGPGDMPGRIVFRTCTDGTITSVERLRIDNTGVVSHRANAQVVIDGNSHLQFRPYTVGTLPSAATAGQQVFCSDLGGGGGMVESDGTVWKRLRQGGQETIATNADFTLTPLANAEDVRHTGTLTASRTITLAATGAYKGLRFRVTRTGSGAFNLSVGGLKNLTQNTFCEVEFDGAAWYLAANGAL
jgi:hypothetical protein